MNDEGEQGVAGGSSEDRIGSADASGEAWHEDVGVAINADIEIIEVSDAATGEVLAYSETITLTPVSEDETYIRGPGEAGGRGSIDYPTEVEAGLDSDLPGGSPSKGQLPSGGLKGSGGVSGGSGGSGKGSTSEPSRSSADSG